MNKIIQTLENKKIAILGFGKEGKSTYNFIRKDLFEESITILCDRLDKDTEQRYLKEDKNLQFISGENYLDNLDKYDIIIKSPGISLKNKNTSKYINKLTTQLELFLENVEAYTIGITGTKGKSTTSTLIYNMLKEQNKKTALIGNIGVPVLDVFEDIDEDTIVIIEMSSHSLEYTKISPNIGIILNIFEEHLDYYQTFEKYKIAKFNIFKYQSDTDYAIFNLDNKEMKKMNFNYNSNSYAVSMENNINNITKNTVYKQDDMIYINGVPVYNINNERLLIGNHNLNDIMFVLAIADILKLDIGQAIKTIKNFKPLEHRMEYVATINKIEYYNDSIATIPESTIESIKALKKVNTLIVGGNDRGVNLSELIRFISNNKVIENVICLPKTGEYISKGLIESNKNIINVKNIEEAVKEANKVTKQNTICLLSPAASSYGYYKNFIERGNLFKHYVLESNEYKKGHNILATSIN